jgi:hypothetical protein
MAFAGGPVRDPTTPADLALRFGCGAIAGVAIVFGTWMAADIFGEGGMTTLAIGVPLTCGVLALLLGDGFFHQLAKLLRWF